MKGRWAWPAANGPLAFGPVDRTASPRARPAAFVDRDGVLNEATPDPDSGAPESPLAVADVRLLEGVATALHALAEAGYALVCVSNQPAAAKGKTSIAELQAVHERVLELLGDEHVSLDGSRLCPHHPHGVVPELSGPCPCRKPAAGMLLDAANALKLDLGASWMLGDTDTDIQAGRAAGCRTILLDYPGSAHKRSGHAQPDSSAGNLGAGVDQILDTSSR
jgi:D-glycero-D-manno-heptose 1,7-bisphosphate phosphatase